MKTDIISVFYSASGATAAGRRLCSVKNRVLFERSEFTRFSVTTDWGANALRSRALLVTFLAEKSNVTSGCKRNLHTQIRGFRPEKWFRNVQIWLFRLEKWFRNIQIGLFRPTKWFCHLQIGLFRLEKWLRNLQITFFRPTTSHLHAAEGQKRLFTMLAMERKKEERRYFARNRLMKRHIKIAP